MSARRILWALPPALLLLAVATYFAAEYWLESAGGRRAVEQELGNSAGMPVRLEGDFDIMLLPALGVVGTELVISDEASGQDLARSSRYEVELALWPLLKKQLHVERLELEHLALGAPGGARMAVPSVEISGFAVNKATDFAIDLGWLGTVEGKFTWRPGDAEIALILTWLPEDAGVIELAGDIRYFTSHVRFDGVKVEAGGQRVTGDGCFIMGLAPSLNLDLNAASLDLDALSETIPGGEGAAGMVPFDINFRLRAGELNRGGIRAIDTVLEVGSAPACP